MCCILLESESETDEDDASEETEKNCIVCNRYHRHMIPVKDLSQDKIQQLMLHTDRPISSLDKEKICRQDAGMLEFMDINLETSVFCENPNRTHRQNCVTCGESLYTCTEDTTLDSETGLLLDNSSICEPISHHHLASSGYVPAAKKAFVLYALRCKFKKTNNRLQLTSCYCRKCHRVLRRKFEYAQKGEYYTPVKYKWQAEKAEECIITGCILKSYKHMAVVPDLMQVLFELETETTVSLCKNHRRMYTRELFASTRCMLCTKLLRKSSKDKKIQPSKTAKEEFTENLINCSLEVELPEDFLTAQYTVHKTCWRGMKLKVERDKAKTPKRRKLYFEDMENKDNSNAKETYCEFDDSAFDEELMSTLVVSNEDDLEEVTEKTLSKEEMMEEADIQTINFIQSELKKNGITTRKEITDVWNENLMTIAFQQGEEVIHIPKLRGDACQRRIESKFNKENEPQTDKLMFTYISKKGGESKFYSCNL